jgi:ABC-type nickel/cobalt efflux system permease component RcnA
VSIFNSTAFGSPITDELKAYPQNMLTAPLSERTAEFKWTLGQVPSSAVALRTRDGRPVEQTRDSLAELIQIKDITPLIALLGLLAAAGLGALHAFSPGHGKAIVGAYLIGSRGTPRHALLLGLTVTVTHTAGVFALGLITLFASRYIRPERVYSILGLVSGAIVVAMGITMLVKRLRDVLAKGGHEGHQEHQHDHGFHSHDGGMAHSHLPPGADGNPITLKGLLVLGISSGLLPCPSALVVMLGAIVNERVAYGLTLIVAFSVGLAFTLTAVGLAFLYGGRFMKRPLGDSHILRLIPIFSALVITCVGFAFCYQALTQAGIDIPGAISRVIHSGGEGEPQIKSMGTFAVLGLGLIFGLKHATEADHIVAVSTIVSEHKNVLRSSLVGGLWGAGHTASLVLVGAVVLALRVAIPERVANWLEFGVAVMIIGLGFSAVIRALRKRKQVHVHRHAHDGLSHAHIHFHDQETQHDRSFHSHSHAVSRIGIKPLLVGAMHGLAGSAALTLLVLTQIDSAFVGLLYLAIFGIGSIVGMLIMSGLIGLPFALGSRLFSGVSYGMQTLAGILSICFGLWYAYETGIASGLLSSLM